MLEDFPIAVILATGSLVPPETAGLRWKKLEETSWKGPTADGCDVFTVQRYDAVLRISHEAIHNHRNATVRLKPGEQVMLRLTQFGLVCSIGFSLCGCGGTSSPDVSDSAAPPDRPASADSVQTAGTNEPAEAASPAAPSEADEPRGFDTPEAAFLAMRDAVGEKDWEQAVDCLTDESQEMMAGGLVLVAGLMAALGGE
ncbi:MAG: hypothetical protein DWQ34_11850, partial [Planctomycetota bacterium]